MINPMKKRETMIIKDERVALVTDLHIGKHQNSSKWHKIALDFAKEFRDKLKEDKIRDVIICGDVNDDRNEISVQSMHIVNEVFQIWKDFNINIIVGNHDAYYKNRSDVNSLSLFSGWDNINIIDEITEYKIFGKKLVFCPWGADVDLVTNCDYLFGHFEINGFNLSKMRVCVKGVDSTNILKKAPLTISGHFHLREDRKYKNGRILYLGSPYELDWGDCGTRTRGFYYFDIPTGEYEFIENKTSPRHKKIRLLEITSAGKVTDDIKKEFDGNFVSFIIDQDVDPEKLQDFIPSLNAYNPLSLKIEHTLEDRVTLEASEFKFTAVDIPTSISEFIKMSDYTNKEEILEETNELYYKCKRGE